MLDDNETDPQVSGDTRSIKQKTTNGNKEKVAALNRYFSTVFTVGDMLYDKSIPNKTDNKLLEIHISVDKIMKKLQKLKTGKSPGPNGIHPRVLKELIEVISLHLAILVNASLELGTLPDEWRTANITEDGRPCSCLDQERPQIRIMRRGENYNHNKTQESCGVICLTKLN